MLKMTCLISVGRIVLNNLLVFLRLKRHVVMQSVSLPKTFRKSLQEYSQQIHLPSLNGPKPGPYSGLVTASLDGPLGQPTRLGQPSPVHSIPHARARETPRRPASRNSNSNSIPPLSLSARTPTPRRLPGARRCSRGRRTPWRRSRPRRRRGRS